MRFKKKLDALSIIFLILSVFFLLELVVKESNPVNVIRVIKQDNIELRENVAPSLISLDKTEINVRKGMTYSIALSFGDGENLDKHVLLESEDENVCQPYVTSFKQLTVSGINVGSTEIKISSKKNSEVTQTLKINVIDGRNFEECSNFIVGFLVDNSFVYGSDLRISPENNIKLVYIARDKMNAILPQHVTYKCESGLDIDAQGNVILTKEDLWK